MIIYLHSVTIDFRTSSKNPQLCGMSMTFADYEGNAIVDGLLKLRDGTSTAVDGTARFGGGSRSARQAGAIVLMALRSCGDQAQLVGADARVWRVNGTHNSRECLFDP